ncbi:MAG: hypothetical protein JOZ20_03880, partial [Sphingomonas sp.]|nr:hypothetical protein [Sphingomonas sp.]
LLTWLYLSSFILLFGGEFNSEVEHQTARDTTADTKEKLLGARGAWSADHIADGPDDEGKEAGRTDDQPLSDNPGARQQPPRRGTPLGSDHPYVVARAANRVASLAGLRHVGMVSAALSTLGLSMLRRRGRAAAGTALLAGAVGLSLLRRDD